uniref:HTH CENPB-type domain-containing protein n=1 Tax=Bionectria ochroleuca TaxID=29856 RepID=A0A8H7TQQ8_BIOOC
MTRYTEESLQNAIIDVGGGMSQRQAAARWGVPLTTVSNRIRGTQSRTVIAESQQRLSRKQERDLAGWILIQDSIGLPPSHRQIRKIAEALIGSDDQARPLGRKWIEGFLLRNPDVGTLRGKRIDFLRVNGATTDKVKDFFKLLDVPAIKKIPPCHRWNMDEAGILEGFGDNGLVLGSSRKRYALRIQPGSRDWTSILEAINAIGIALPPLVIFKGESVQQQWFFF